MPVLQIGSGRMEIESGKSLRDAQTVLKNDREQAKTLGVNSVIQDAIVASFNGTLVDLSTPVTTDGTVVFYTAQSPEGLDTLRHSASHLMAQAILRLYPGSKLGIGPAIKDGFYYDIEPTSPVTEADLEKIEAEMKKIVEESLFVTRAEMSKKEALELFKKQGQAYKLELIEALPGDTVSVYSQGGFSDLCRGPHVPNTRALKAFKLMSVSGAYWKGKEGNPMLTRVYGTAFADKKELESYLHMIEEAKARDHRKIGKEMGLFSFHEQGPGLPFWKPRGLALKNALIAFEREKHAELNYMEVETPTFLSSALWKTSGHWDNYRDNMYFMEKDEEQFALKPMNCPGGILIYKEEMHSYRELPMKIAEFGKVHRYERSGVMQGMFRVRGFTQDDAHIYTSPEKLQESVVEIIRLVDTIYKTFGFEYSVELSTRPDKSMGSDEMWEIATSGLKNALDSLGMVYKINEGDGAFYGPKIDYHLKDAIGRTHQCGTIQLDMQNPERFDMNYIAEDGKEHRVIMLHRAIMGSLERFSGILIEHYAGKFPAWLSPVQVTVLPVSDKFNENAVTLEKELKGKGIRADVDASSEKLGYKIRKAQMSKVPYMLVIGEQEAASGTVSVRHRDKGDLGSRPAAEFTAQLLEEIAKRV